MDLLKIILDYCDLGYDVTPTRLHGKDAIRMSKRYSHKAERAIHCEQIIHHEHLMTEEGLRRILGYMYENIAEQEMSEKYYELFGS